MTTALSPLGQALLTHDWDGIREGAGRRTKSGRLASALVGIRDENFDEVVDSQPAEPGEALRYLGDVARFRRGTLGAERSDEFADAFARLHQDDIVTIATIQKSGTHWMRFFLTNYARALSDPSVEQPIAYPELLRDYYGNNRWQVFREAEPYRRPIDLLVDHGISDVTMQHFRGDFDPFVFSPGKKIMLYRNPLDFVISLYHYMIKQRPQNRGKADHPRDVIESMLTEYAHHYLTLTSYSDDDDVLIASYESLRADPSSRFRDVVRFLGLPLDEGLVDRALMLSDISTIRQMEQQQGRSMVVKLDGYFTRDGSIGQWKEYFDEGDLERVRDVLGHFGISLESFVVDE